MKKFELTSETINYNGRILFRIKSLIDFADVKAGDLGGFIEKEENLSTNDNAEVCCNADYTTIKGFGTVFRTTTFFRCKDKRIRVSCGCFYGTIDEFREQVKKTRTDKIAKEYLMIADLMEYHFKVEEEK